MTARQWQNLSLAALAMFYLLQFLLPILQGDLLEGPGSDYRAFWAAGRIINLYGYADVYSLPRLEEVQKPLTPNADFSQIPFSPVPAPYFPIFLVPLRLLALLPAPASFWLWEFLNLTGIVAYLIFFVRRQSPEARIGRILALCLSFAPLVSSLWWGQPGLWLMMCAGEFYWNVRQGRSMAAGAWLAGWLFKPQLLTLLLPALLLQKQWRALMGFAIVGAVVAASSILLLGRTGLMNFLLLLGFWGDASGGLPAINPYLMMNWRMLALHAENLVGPAIGQAILILGTVGTSVAALWGWRKPLSLANHSLAVRLFGLFAASCAVAWHAHLHSLMILTPLFAILLLENEIPGWLEALWLYLLPLSLAATLAAGLLIRVGLLPFVDAIGGLITGISGLAASLIFLGWSLRWQKRFSSLGG